MPRTGLCRVEAWLRRRQVLPARHNSEGDASAFRHRRRGGDVMRVAPRVPITGPLQPYFDGFVAELEAHGYTDLSAANQLRLMADLSRWLEQTGGAVDEVDRGVIERFLAKRRRTHTQFISDRAVRPLLRYLEDI